MRVASVPLPQVGFELTTHYTPDICSTNRATKVAQLACIHVCIDIYVCMYVQIYMYVCMYRCTSIYVCTDVHACM